MVHQFVSERFGISLSRSGCLNYLYRLRFVLKRPKKRLVKADEGKREFFVAEYAALTEEARRSGAKILFADEAHFRADSELRGKWVLKGEPALVDSSSPRHGEKASYYSAVCMETGDVPELLFPSSSINSGTSAAFLKQLRDKHEGPLNLIWDNAPAHRGETVWHYLGTPGLELRLVNPRFHEGRLCRAIYSPDFNVDEAAWGWVREEADGNLCMGMKALVQERVRGFLTDLDSSRDDVNTALLDRPAGACRKAPVRTSTQFPTLSNCTSYLALPLVQQLNYWLSSLYWTLRILSGISEGICNTMVQSGGEFLYIGVGGR